MFVFRIPSWNLDFTEQLAIEDTPSGRLPRSCPVEDGKSTPR